MVYSRPKVTGDPGSFLSLRTLSFNPLWFISQNASSESILFFGQLYQTLGGPLRYTLSLTVADNWHIKLQCNQWAHIISTIIPYLNQLYVEKYTGMLKMLRIHTLLSIANLSLLEKTHQPSPQYHFIWSPSSTSTG